jgi:hypothetical protein
MAQIIEAQSFRQLGAFQYRLKMLLYDIQPYKWMPFTSGKYKTRSQVLPAASIRAFKSAVSTERFAETMHVLIGNAANKTLRSIFLCGRCSYGGAPLLFVVS